MSDEEIRLRCLELAATFLPEGELKDMETLADRFVAYAKQDRYPTVNPNRLDFEKISKERE